MVVTVLLTCVCTATGSFLEDPGPAARGAFLASLLALFFLPLASLHPSFDRQPAGTAAAPRADGGLASPLLNEDGGPGGEGFGKASALAAHDGGGHARAAAAVDVSTLVMMRDPK